MDLKALAKKHNISDLEEYNNDSSNYLVSFVANKLKQTEVTHTSGSAYRIVDNGRIGFASSYGKANTEETIIKAKELSRFSPETLLELPCDINLTENKKDNSDVNDFFTVSDKGEKIIEYIKENTKSEALLTDITFERTDLSESVCNTRDIFYNSSKSIYSFSINLRETFENDFIEIFNGVTDLSKLDYKNCVDESLYLYNCSKRHAKIKNGNYPILFSSRAAKDLIDIIELALSGKQVNQKSSPWHDKLQKQVLSSTLTMYQDPGFGYMARLVDDEGNYVKKLSFIDSGVLKNFYFDLLTASRSPLKATSTGNGFRASLTAPPEPELLNLVVNTGKRSLTEIIKDLKYGLLVDQTIGGLSSNISGDMSVNVDLGFLIENGEIVGRVKDTMISGNVYNALNNVIELSDTQKGYWSNIYNPDMLLEGFTVTAQ